MDPLLLQQVLEQALFSQNMGGIATSAPTDSIRRTPDGGIELNTREDGLHDVMGDLVPGSPFERLLMQAIGQNRGALNPGFGLPGGGGPTGPKLPQKVRKTEIPPLPPINFP